MILKSNTVNIIRKTNIFQYAGANSPLYILKNNEIEILKADRQPIGYVENYTPFTNHTIDLNKIDSIYLFTDGFADQFGGSKGKKLGYKKFRELLFDNHTKELQNQEGLLLDFINNWMNISGEEQIDDICVVGLKL